MDEVASFDRATIKGRSRPGRALPLSAARRARARRSLCANSRPLGCHGGAHHGDDLLDGGWVGWVAEAFVARWAALVGSWTESLAGGRCWPAQSSSRMDSIRSFSGRRSTISIAARAGRPCSSFDLPTGGPPINGPGQSSELVRPERRALPDPRERAAFSVPTMTALVVVPRGSQPTDRADWRRRRRCRVLHQGSDCVNPSAGKAIARKAMSGSAKAMSASPLWRTSKRR